MPNPCLLALPDLSSGSQLWDFSLGLHPLPTRPFWIHPIQLLGIVISFVSSGEYLQLLGVEDREGEAGEELLTVGGEEGEWQGVDYHLDLIGGGVEGHPGRVTHGEGTVELGSEGVDVRCEGSCRGSMVGDKKGD